MPPPPRARAGGPLVEVRAQAAGLRRPPVLFAGPGPVSAGPDDGCTFAVALEDAGRADLLVFGLDGPSAVLGATHDVVILGPTPIRRAEARGVAGQIALDVGSRGRVRIGSLELEFRVTAPPTDGPRPALLLSDRRGPCCAACRASLPPGLELAGAWVACPRCGVLASPPGTAGGEPRKLAPDLSGAPRVKIPTLPWLKATRRAG